MCTGHLYLEGNTFFEVLVKSGDIIGVLRKGWEGQRQVKVPKCTASALSEEDAADRGLPDSNL